VRRIEERKVSPTGTVAKEGSVNGRVKEY